MQVWANTGRIKLPDQSAAYSYSLVIWWERCNGKIIRADVLSTNWGPRTRQVGLPVHRCHNPVTTGVAYNLPGNLPGAVTPGGRGNSFEMVYHCRKGVRTLNILWGYIHLGHFKKTLIELN